MRVFAVMSANPDDHEDLEATLYPNVLVSFMFDRDRTFLSRIAYRPERLFLDSGAYSVWSTGATVDVAAYAAWALAYSAEIETTVANLDVIPGEPGRAPSSAERHRAVAQGMENADYLRSRGLLVTEAYHRFEPLEVLEQIVERRRPGEVMAIGGLVGGRDTQAKLAFCDSAFARLRDLSDGWKSTVPVHGFGLGPEGRLGRRYPWYSIDCASWFLGRRFRTILHPQPKAGRPVTEPMAHLYFQRKLREWIEAERTLTQVWDARVAFAT